MPPKQSKAELMQHLKEQVGFLMKSCEEFDGGDRAEYKRMTGPMRILFHDKGRQVSLLSNLGDKDQLLFYDTARDIPSRSELPKLGLALMKVIKGGPSVYEAPLDIPRPGVELNKKVPFSTWWSKPILTFGEYSITRSELILTVAEKDGGVHVDEALETAYHLLTRLNGLGWRSTNMGVELYIPLSDGPQPPPPPGTEYFGDVLGPESASMRQIAHEVIKTIKEEYEL